MIIQDSVALQFQQTDNKAILHVIPLERRTTEIHRLCFALALSAISGALLLFGDWTKHIILMLVCTASAALAPRAIGTFPLKSIGGHLAAMNAITVRPVPFTLQCLADSIACRTPGHRAGRFQRQALGQSR